MRRAPLVAASSLAWVLAVVALNGGALSRASAWCSAAISWPDTPSRATVLARNVYLASLTAFGPVSLNDLRRAAGVGPAANPRMN